VWLTKAVYVYALHRGSHCSMAQAVSCCQVPLVHANQPPLSKMQSAANLESDSCKQRHIK